MDIVYRSASTRSGARLFDRTSFGGGGEIVIVERTNVTGGRPVSGFTNPRTSTLRPKSHPSRPTIKLSTYTSSKDLPNAD